MEYCYQLEFNLNQELSDSQNQTLQRLLQEERLEDQLNTIVENELQKRLRERYGPTQRDDLMQEFSVDVTSRLTIRHGSIIIDGDIIVLMSVIASIIAIKNELVEIVKTWYKTTFGSSPKPYRPRITPTLGTMPSQSPSPLEIKLSLDKSTTSVLEQILLSHSRYIRIFSLPLMLLVVLLLLAFVFEMSHFSR